MINTLVLPYGVVLVTNKLNITRCIVFVFRPNNCR